jgi:hypothetical protein
MYRLLLSRMLAAFAVACLLSSCAGPPRPPPRLADDVRSSLGTVGVITVGPPLGGEVDGPVGVGGQAAVGALGGAAVGTAGGFGAGFALGLLCGPGAFICSPVAALGGAIVGLVGGGTYGGIRRGRNAIPESTAAEIQTSLNQAIADRDLQADLRQRVLQHTGSAAMGLDLGTGATEPVAVPDYASMVDRGVGTVLEVSLTQLTFTGEGGSDPTLALVVSARARLIRIADKRELWNAPEVTYESPAAAFSLWGMLDSGLLRGEIDKGMEALARQIGNALFDASVAANLEETMRTPRLEAQDTSELSYSAAAMLTER